MCITEPPGTYVMDKNVMYLGTNFYDGINEIKVFTDKYIKSIKIIKYNNNMRYRRLGRNSYVENVSK